MAITAEHAEKKNQILTEHNESLVPTVAEQDYAILMKTVNDISPGMGSIVIGYFLIVVLALILNSIIEGISGMKNQSILSLLIFCFCLVGFFFLAGKVYPPFVKAKERRRLLRKAASLKKQIDDEKSEVLEKKEMRELDMNKAIDAIKAEEKQAIQEVDDWLSNAVRSIHAA